MEFKDNAKIETDDFWYDILQRERIKPNIVLKDLKDIMRVNTAIATLQLFKMEAEKQGVLSEDML